MTLRVPAGARPDAPAGRSRHDPYVTTEAIPTDALRELPGSGLVPWLAALWRDLRRAVENATATKEERELLLLLDYAASKLGDVLLGATDLDDLDDRLDALLDDPDMFHWNALATRLASAMAARPAVPAQVFASACEPLVGPTPARLLADAAPLLDAWMRSQRMVLATDADTTSQAVHAAEALGPAILTSPTVPAEVSSALAGAFRAGLVLLALGRAAESAKSIEPWLALAFVERFVAGVHAHLRLLAAFPGVSVPDDVLPASERLDLEHIFERHARARAHADRSYEAARARLARDA